MQLFARRLGDDIDVAAEDVALVREAKLRLPATKELGKRAGKVLLNQLKLTQEHGLHRRRQFDNQRFQIVLGLVQIFALRVQLTVPLEHGFVFFNRTQIDVAQRLDLRLDFGDARVARANGDVPLERGGVFVGQFVFAPNVVLHRTELHLEPALRHLLFVEPLRQIARGNEQFLAARALFRECGGYRLPLFLELALCFLLRARELLVALNLGLHLF